MCNNEDISPERYATVLCIAGVDPSGGAGLFADIKVCTLLGVYACGVPTALTAQNTLGVKSVEPVGVSVMADDLEFLLDDVRPDAVKIGMIPTPEGVELISMMLSERALKNIVVDPVLVSTSGKPLVDSVEEAVAVRRQLLFPLASLITPNIPESVLFGLDNPSCSCPVLLKGGHGDGDESADILRMPDGRDTIFSGKRIMTEQSHGTGCVLSSAIACGLAKGHSVEASVREAKRFLTERLQKGEGYRLGHGHGPLYLL